VLSRNLKTRQHRGKKERKNKRKRKKKKRMRKKNRMRRKRKERKEEEEKCRSLAHTAEVTTQQLLRLVFIQ